MHKTLQGHLTNTKQSRVTRLRYYHPRQRMSWKELSSVVVEKAASDCWSLTKDGREFQAWAAATGNTQSPRVRHRVAGTISVDVAAETAGTAAGCQMQGLGEVPWRCTTKTSETRTHSRNFIFSGTLNHWSSQSSGVMCSDFLAENTSRAAAFNTDWNRLNRVSNTPASTELP